jgi:hypothetical protein
MRLSMPVAWISWQQEMQVEEPSAMQVESPEPASIAPLLLPLLLPPLLLVPPLLLPPLPLLPLLVLPPLLLPPAAQASDACDWAPEQPVQPAQVKASPPTLYVIDSHAPAALVVVQTFIVAPPVQVAPLAHVVTASPLALPLLPVPDPLDEPLLLEELLPPFPLPLVEPFPELPPDPPAVNGFAAPEQATRTPSVPIQATTASREPSRAGASFMPPPTFHPARISPAGTPMWTRSNGGGQLQPRADGRVGILEVSPMSVFSKPPNDGSGNPGGNKHDAQAAKPSAAPKPAAPPATPASPPVIVSRTIEIGGSPRSQPRPSAPTIQIGPPTRPSVPGAASPPAPSKTPTLKMEANTPKSVRPTAPAMTPGDGVASIADTFEKLLASDV